MTKGKKIAMYLFLILASFISVFPLYWMVSAATNTSDAVLKGRIIPGTHLIENFHNLVNNQSNIGNAMWNSFRYAAILTIISLVICSLAGYGFEIYHDKAKDAVMSIILLAMMVPFVATMVPLFQMFSNVKVLSTIASALTGETVKVSFLNNAIGFILPTISTPFLIMMFRQAARSFPHDIIEASRLEGLSEIKIFFTMFLPIMKSTYGAAMTVTFMNAWNNYLWPTIILQDKNQITMPMLVANLKSGYSVDYGMLMLGVLICTLPTAVIFLCLQKSFANGIAGAVK